MQQCTDESNFVGDYQAGKRHGWGTYTFPNGDRYMGQYQEDMPHGYGVYIFASGQTYEGEWQMGRKNGWCIYTVDSGEQWAGRPPITILLTAWMPLIGWLVWKECRHPLSPFPSLHLPAAVPLGGGGGGGGKRERERERVWEESQL